MTPLRTAAIVAVGSELVTPHRSDTNSLYLTAKLNDLGIEVRAKFVARDDRRDVAAFADHALGVADLLILTGGLGPTDDDVTREAVAEAFGLVLEEDDGILAFLQDRFARRGLAMPAINRKQAQVPRGAVALANVKGTAPGLWIERGAQVVVLLPGPPNELEAMYTAHVEPRLEARTAARRLHRRVIKIAGRAESAVDEVAQPIYQEFLAWPTPIATTILAARGQIELHLSASGADEAAIGAALDRTVGALAGALGPAVFSVDGRSLEAVVGHMLGERGLRIAVAESCTGGLVMARLTAVPGSSGWVIGGVVAYANEIKERELGVAHALLVEHGAVSEPVAAAMARGIAQRLGAEVGVGVTGIAGPAGGTPEKPVGTVVIAVDVAAAQRHAVQTHRFVGDRDLIRQFAAQAAIDLVRRTLLENSKYT